MSGFEAAFAGVSDVEGWMTEAQARRLWDAAQRVPANGRIVEIGSFRGRSIIVLAKAAAASVELVAIDPHAGGDRGPNEIAPVAELGADDHTAFTANLARAGVADRIRHIRKMSDEALSDAPDAIDVLYVDGAHRYAPARADIEQWGARVGDGGTMLIHDAFSAVGVMLAQLRVLFVSREWSYVGRSGSLAEYRRERPALLPNLLRQCAALPYWVRNQAIKVLIVARLKPLTRLLGHRSGDWPY